MAERRVATHQPLIDSLLKRAAAQPLHEAHEAPEGKRRRRGGGAADSERRQRRQPFHCCCQLDLAPRRHGNTEREEADARASHRQTLLLAGAAPLHLTHRTVVHAREEPP